MTREELIQTYNSYSDEELTEAWHSIHDYTPEAIEVLTAVIEKRGGIEALLEKEQVSWNTFQESERIKQQIRQMATPGVEPEFLNKMISSELLDETQRLAIIRETFDSIAHEKEDMEIKPRTLVGGSLAAGLAAVIGGILWGLQLMWSGRIFYIFLIGLVLLCYSIIRLCTKQSHKNTAVLILTFISTVLALAIGQLMYEFWGRQ
jgi:hypothetical protein